jgi:medium-chain acyl-[acyl-carrier-protein] hydrolase
MREKYLTAFPIRYQDTDPSLRASLAGLLGLMQEAAILHAEEVGRGMAWLSERHISWMIVQIRARILHRPSWRTRIQVATWPSEIGRFLSTREFQLSDETGRTLLRATTLWAFMDTQARRAARVPPEVASVYAVVPERALEVPFGRPLRAEAYPWSSDHRVRAGDIDFNDHANNLRYLEWITESLPGELSHDASIAEINIRFQKEASRGQDLVARSAELPAGSEPGRRFAHEIALAPAGDLLCCADTRWIED